MTHALTRPRRVPPDEVLARLGEPEPMTKAKVFDRVDQYSRRFIAHSPS